MISNTVTFNGSIKVSLLSQEDTSKLNEKSSDDTANSNKDYNNKRQKEKLQNQILYVRKSRLQTTKISGI